MVGDGGAYFLPRLAPFGKAATSSGRALELLVSEAERLGILNRVVPRDQLEQDTYAFAKRLAALPPLAVRMTKRLTYQSAKADLVTALDLASSQSRRAGERGPSGSGRGISTEANG
jgi:enoyl-CoA hydratase/carnithine racemase